MAKIKLTKANIDRLEAGAITKQNVVGTISGVAAVYQRHEFLGERKEALHAWGRHLRSKLHQAQLIKTIAA